MFRTSLAGILLALSTEVSAQITTYVAPPRSQAPSPQMVAAADSVQRDSIAKATMTNMKAWVDSAAGVTVPAHVGDSLPANDPGLPVTTTFNDGAVAPATASSLPAVSLLGTLAIIAGALLLAKRRRA
jgi:LPXTG-motif cell wall-anchored protein